MNIRVNLESCLQLVCDRGIMTIERECGRCGEQMHWKRDVSKADGYRWRCSRQYRASCSLRTDTFFQNSKLSLLQILIIMFCWCQGMKQVETRVDTCISANSIVKAIQSQDVRKSGGVGKIVEIDESKFGKCKYNREHGGKGNGCSVGLNEGMLSICF